MKTIALALLAIACATCAPLCAAQTQGHTFAAYRQAASVYGPMLEAWKLTRPLPDRQIVECAVVKDDAAAFADLYCDQIAGADELTEARSQAIQASLVEFAHSHIAMKSIYAGVPCVLPTGMAKDAAKDLCNAQVRGKIDALAMGRTTIIATRLDRQLVYCSQIKIKISIQMDAAAAGQAGFYNMDALQNLERQACGENGPM